MFVFLRDTHLSVASSVGDICSLLVFFFVGLSAKKSGIRISKSEVLFANMRYGIHDFLSLHYERVDGIAS